MQMPLLERIKHFQDRLLEIGVARAVLALPAPRMLALAGPSIDEGAVIIIFTQAVTEQEIIVVTRDLFASGHISLAVQEAYKAVEKFIQEKAVASEFSGTTLMDNVFGPTKPRLVWSEMQSKSEQDEQKGYHRLYAGAMLGIRNPVTHEFNWVNDESVALELILFAQHLLRKAKRAISLNGTHSNSTAA